MKNTPESYAALTSELGALACRFDVDVLESAPSTNSELMQRAEQGAPSGTVVLARQQSAGRGRMGRTWFAEADSSLAFSLLWRFPPRTLPLGLSLTVGLGVCQALESLGFCDVQLKWPNDVLYQGRKLAGILIELQSGKPHCVIIGIGLNLRLPANLPDDVRQTAAALNTDLTPARILARLLQALQPLLDNFATGGFAAAQQEWLARCAHLQQPIRILSEFNPPLLGQCLGVDQDGALLLQTEHGIERIMAGEVSLRGAP